MIRQKTQPIIFALTTLCALLTSPSVTAASGFGCDGVAGGVIFKDTLYGAGTGALVGMLVVAAQDDRSDSAQTIANGGLVGSVLGLGLGILEITTRDCYEPSRRGEHIRTTPIFAWRDNKPIAGFGVSLTIK